MTYKDYLRKLRAARTQEDIDGIVRAYMTCKALTDTDRGKLLKHTKDRRAKLPGRN